MGEFQEKNLNGSRFQPFKKLNQGIIQGGGNTAPIETETLREMTQSEIEKAEAEAGD